MSGNTVEDRLRKLESQMKTVHEAIYNTQDMMKHGYEKCAYCLQLFVATIGCDVRLHGFHMDKINSQEVFACCSRDCSTKLTEGKTMYSVVPRSWVAQ